MNFIQKIIENDYNSEATKAFIYQFVKWSPGYALILLVIGSINFLLSNKRLSKAKNL